MVSAEQGGFQCFFLRCQCLLSLCGHGKTVGKQGRLSHLLKEPLQTGLLSDNATQAFRIGIIAFHDKFTHRRQVQQQPAFKLQANLLNLTADLCHKGFLHDLKSGFQGLNKAVSRALKLTQDLQGCFIKSCQGGSFVHTRVLIG